MDNPIVQSSRSKYIGTENQMLIENQMKSEIMECRILETCTL